jgi:predicted nucleic acid-binding protein
VATLIRINEKDEDRVWKLFLQYEDKGFSFTDCTPFALMERLKINTVFLPLMIILLNMENL